jgi:hypothetical protein
MMQQSSNSSTVTSSRIWNFTTIDRIYALEFRRDRVYGNGGTIGCPCDRRTHSSHRFDNATSPWTESNPHPQTVIVTLAMLASAKEAFGTGIALHQDVTCTGIPSDFYGAEPKESE